MTGISPIELYRAAKPDRFRILRSLEISQSPPESGSTWQADVRMVLRSLDSEASLVLTFSGVTQLAVLPQGTPMSMGILSIEDLSDHHWEGIRYRVKDVEQEETFSCFCAGFAVNHS